MSTLQKFIDYITGNYFDGLMAINA